MKKIVLIFLVALFVTTGAFAKKKKNADALIDLESPVESVSPLDDSSSSSTGANGALSGAEGTSDSNGSSGASSGYDMSAPLNDRPDYEGVKSSENPADLSAAWVGDDSLGESFEDEYFDPDSDEEEDYLVKDPKKNRDRIDMPHRTFEMGMKVDVGANNSYLNTTDILVQNLVIDVNKIADEMPDNGLMFNLLFGYNYFTNLNLKNGVHVGFDTGIELNGNFGLGKEIFEFLSKGNSVGETIKATGDAYADAFMHTDITVGLTILDGYHLEITPSLFRPLAHVGAEKAVGKLTNTEDGKVYLDASAELNVYTFFDASSIQDNFTPDLILDKIKDGWGFDITSSLDKQILKTLTLQAYSRIPIVPGRLNYNTKLIATAKGHFDGLGTIIGDSVTETGDFGEKMKKQFEDNFEFKTDYVTEGVSYSLNRPFRMGAQAAWEPFGSWFTLGGLLGFGFKEPFSSNAKGYMEYQISSQVGLPVPVIGQIMFLKLSSGYLSESFVHQAVFGLNFRAVEFNVGISAQGSSFASSFKGSGVGAYVYLAFGW